MPKALTLREQGKRVVPTKSVRTVARSRKVQGRQKSALVGKILVPTDFSKESEAGVRAALCVAQSFGAAVEFIYVVEVASGLSGIRAGALASRNAALERAARGKLEQLAKRGEVCEGAEVSCLVGVGKPFDQIVETARKGKADLIVMSTLGRTGLKRMFIGSTAENVVRHAPCPVMTVPSTWKERQFRPTRIFVPVDFSDLSKGALVYARHLAEVYHAEIVLGHAVDISAFVGLSTPEMGNIQMIVPTLDEAKADLEKWASELRPRVSVPVTAQVQMGSPTHQVCAMAERAKADLIILTTQGKTGLTRVLLGSTAEAVVRYAKCPVLVVRGRTSTSD